MRSLVACKGCGDTSANRRKIRRSLRPQWVGTRSSDRKPVSLQRDCSRYSFENCSARPPSSRTDPLPKFDYLICPPDSRHSAPRFPQWHDRGLCQVSHWNGCKTDVPLLNTKSTSPLQRQESLTWWGLAETLLCVGVAAVSEERYLIARRKCRRRFRSVQMKKRQ